MKRAITSVVFIISFVSMLVLSLVSRVQAGECSNVSVKGTYGFSCQGTFIHPTLGPLPFVAVGVETHDGQGNLSATETLSFNGIIVTPITVTGTYMVNSDCTGSEETIATIGGIQQPPGHANFVIDDNTKETRFIGTDPGAVLVCIARKQ